MPHRGAQWVHAHVHLLYHLPEEVKHFYELAIVKQFLGATIGVFIPAYLYVKTHTLVFPLLYIMLAWGVFTTIVAFINAVLLRRWGVERLMYMGIVALVIESFLVVMLPTTTWAVVLIAAAESVSMSTYWDAFHTSFGVFGKRREEVTEVAGMSVALSITSIVAPMFMAVLITALGYQGAFAAMVIAGAFLATLLIRHFPKKHTIKVKLRSLIHVPFAKTWFISGIFFFSASLVPLYVFHLSNDVPEMLGTYMSIMGLVAALTSLHVARAVDKKEKYWLALILPVASGTLFLVYPHIRQLSLILLFEVLRQLSNAPGIAIYGALYNVAKRSPSILLGRNLLVRMGKGVGAALVFLFGPSFATVFYIGALAAFIYTLGLYYVIRKLHAVSSVVAQRET